MSKGLVDVPPKRANALLEGLIVSSVRLHITLHEGLIVSLVKFHIPLIEELKSPGYLTHRLRDLEFPLSRPKYINLAQEARPKSCLRDLILSLV